MIYPKLITLGDLTVDTGSAEEDRKSFREAIQALKDAGIDPRDLFRRDLDKASDMSKKYSPDVSIDDQFEAYLKNRIETEKDLKPSSVREARQSFKLYQDYIKTNNLSEVTQRIHSDFTDFLKTQRANSNKIKDKSKLKPLANGTMNKHIGNINKFYEYLNRKHLCNLQKIPTFKKRQAVKVKYFSDDMLRRVINEVILKSNRKEDAVAFAMCLSTGCRIGEIAQIRTNDINIKDGVWHIVIEETEDEDGDDKTIKNENSRRIITIPSFLIPYFKKTKELRIKRNMDKFFITIKPDSHGSVSGLISKRFAYALNKITRDKSYRLHSFRHTFTTKAHALNMFTDANIKKVTGHKTGEVHHDIYQHQDLYITKEIIEAIYSKLINDDEISRIVDKLK